MSDNLADETMQTFTYAAEFEPGDKRGVFVVSFPDVPEAITQGDDDGRARPG
jgi:antitoxin HicB